MKMSRFGCLVLAIVALPVVALGQDIGVRVATFNIQQFNPGDSTQFDAAVAILNRVGADVVCVQELTGSGDLAILAAASGYTFSFTASTVSAIGFTLRSGVLSKHPFTTNLTLTSAFLSGDATARDIVRNFVSVEVAVPGAVTDLVIIGNHWKASTGDLNEFRRSIESIRGMQATGFHDSASVPYLILGDMNDNLGTAHTPDPFTQAWFDANSNGLPASYKLGIDIVFPLDNGPFRPLQAGVGSQALTVIDAFQKDGSNKTMVSGSSRLDYIWHSDTVTLTGSEVYDSLDEGLGGGLPKFGSPLPSGTSADASDHLMVFADIRIPSTVVGGACCQPGGICTNGFTQADCDLASGHFYGSGTDCAGPLDPPCAGPGACCLAGGVCANGIDSFVCIGSNGFYYGAGSDCAGPLDPPCEAPGACCDPGGACREDLGQFGCDGIGGFFYGTGTTCAGPLDPSCDPLPITAVINEVLAMQDATDTMEFVELFGTPYGVLDGFSVLVIEGETLSKGIIDRIIDLTGFQIPPDGYFVMGDTAVAPDLEVGTSFIFENGSETFLLVQNLPGGVTVGTDVDTDNDGVADISVGTVMDGVGLVGGSGYPDYAIYYGAPEVGPQNSAFPDGGARIPNGVDTDTSADWTFLSGALDGSEGDHPITPGAANAGTGDFDGDGDRDLRDFAALQRCFTGPGGGPLGFGCDEGDFDADTDIDLDDHSAFVNNLTGP